MDLNDKLRKLSYPLYGGIASCTVLIGFLIVMSLFAGLFKRPITWEYLAIGYLFSFILDEKQYITILKKILIAEVGDNVFPHQINIKIQKRPLLLIALFLALAELMADTILIYLAYKNGMSPLWAFSILMGSKAIGSVLQGFISNYISPLNQVTVCFVCLGTVFLILDLLAGKLPTIQLYITAICIRGLLCNLKVTGREIYTRGLDFKWKT